jgi:hypothetical protein
MKVRVRSLALCLVLCGCSSKVATGPTRAAIAFRDNVPEYQKVASKQYTMHYLDGHYVSVEYLEATPVDPGETRWLAAVESAALTNDSVDCFFLSNSGDYATWGAALSPVARAKLRFVYSTGAGGSWQGPAWLKLGAHAYIGHPSGNVAPLFWRYFLPAWVDGTALQKSMDDANTGTRDDMSGTIAKGVEKALEAVNGPRIDRPKLISGTEAVLYGDGTLTVK